MPITMQRKRVATAAAGTTLAIAAEAGMLAVNRGHFHAMSLLATNGLYALNPDAIAGKPEFRAAIQRRIAYALRVPCHVAGGTDLDVNMPGIRYFRLTEILFTNATKTPDPRFRASMWTNKDKTGTQLFPANVPVTDLAPDLFSTFEWPLTGAQRKRRAAPYLRFYPEVVNPEEMYMDIFVLGDVLEWEHEHKWPL